MVPAGQYPPVNPVKFILLCLAGWMQREQQAVIDYPQEEVRVLKDHCRMSTGCAGLQGLV
jgi:hypothetical protein